MTCQSEANDGGDDQFFFKSEQTGSPAEILSFLENIFPAQLQKNLQEACETWHLRKIQEDNEDAERIREPWNAVFYRKQQEIQ